MRAATFVLLFAAALASSTAQQGDNDVALHALAASSRAALASATLSSRFPTFFAQGFLPLHSSHARRLLDSSDSNDNQGGDDMPSCATDLPCVQKLLQLQNNASAFSDVMAVTNASQCPTQPADADKCFYAQMMACSNASSGSSGSSKPSGSSGCNKNGPSSSGAPGGFNSGFQGPPQGSPFDFGGPCGSFNASFNASGAPPKPAGDSMPPGMQQGNFSGQPGNFTGQPGNFSGQPGNFSGQPGNFSCPPPFNGTGSVNGPGSMPVCARAMVPSDAFQPCAEQALTQMQAQSAGRMLKAMPPATSNCSAGADSGGGDGGDAMESVAMSFPCFQNLMRSFTTASLSFMISNATVPVCPSPEYACNCFATIATSCPELNVTSMNTTKDNHTDGGNHTDCGGGNDDGNNGNGNNGGGNDDDSMSPQCDAFRAVMDLTLGFAGSCPANFFESGAIVVLTDAAAVTPPVIPTELPVLPPLSKACAAVLGVAAPRPPPTTAPVALLSAAVTLGGYSAETFTSELRTGFVTAVSTMLNVDAADVVITSVKDAPAAARRRQLLASSGVVVEFTVAAPTADAVATISTDIGAMSTTDSAAFTTQLRSAGLSDVTAVEAASAPTQVAASSGAAPTTAAVALALLAAAFVVLA